MAGWMLTGFLGLSISCTKAEQQIEPGIDPWDGWKPCTQHSWWVFDRLGQASMDIFDAPTTAFLINAMRRTSAGGSSAWRARLLAMAGGGAGHAGYNGRLEA